MEEWILIGKDRKIKSMLNDKLILVAPADTSNVVPLFCPCCEFPMRSSEDGVSFRKQGVCSHCDNRWTNKPGVSWPAGPDKSSEDWETYIKYRNTLSKPVITFK
jgi:hypothetical protein